MFRHNIEILQGRCWPGANPLSITGLPLSNSLVSDNLRLRLATKKPHGFKLWVGFVPSDRKGRLPDKVNSQLI